MCNSCITAKIAVRRKDTNQTTLIHTGLAKRSVGEDRRTFVRTLEVAVRIANREDVERSTRSVLDDRRERESVHEFLPTTARTPTVRTTKYSTENEPVSLIEQRISTLGAEVGIVLRLEQRL